MADLAVFYEHPQWFEPLFRELVSNRGLRPNLVGTAARSASGSPPAKPPAWTSCCCR
jgi:hypothetical protein